MASISLISQLKLRRTVNNFDVVSGGINCIYENIGTEKEYTTQSTSFKGVFQNPNKVSTDSSRGMIINDTTSFLIFAYGPSVFRFSYSGQIAGITLAGQTTRIYMCQLNTDTFLLDRFGNRFYAIDSLGISTEILQLKAILDDIGSVAVRGCAVLNGIVYIQAESGEIYNSAVENISSWSALDFISSESLPDKPVYIDSINNSIVSFNTNSIEFFNDNANPTGSPLVARQDVIGGIGGINSDCYVKNGNSIYFVGSEFKERRSLSVYVLENFTVTKISTYSIDLFLGSFIDPSMSGYYDRGRFFVSLLGKREDSNNNNLIFDAKNGMWTVQDNDSIRPIIESNSSRQMTYDGDIKFVDTAINPTNINSSLILENTNFGTNKFKRIKKLSINSLPSVDDFHINVEASSNGIKKFERKFNINGNKDTKNSQRLGRFKTIQFRIDFGSIIGNDLSASVNQYVELKSLEIDF